MSDKISYQNKKMNETTRCEEIYKGLVRENGQYQEKLYDFISTVEDDDYRREMLNIFTVLKSSYLDYSRTRCSIIYREFPDRLQIGRNTALSYNCEKGIWEYLNTCYKNNILQKVQIKVGFSDKNEIEFLEYSNDKDHKGKISKIELITECNDNHILRLYDKKEKLAIELVHGDNKPKEVKGLRGRSMESLIRNLEKRRIREDMKYSSKNLYIYI